MNIKILIPVLLISQCLFLGCDSKPDNKNLSNNSNQKLQLKIETDRSEYLLGETVIVHMYLKNNTNKDIVICAWPSREENLFIFYENNNEIPYKDIVTFDRPVSKDKSFITIKPEVEIDYSSPGFAEDFGGKYFDTVGRWDLRITHFHDFTGERFGLDGWKGKLTSNVLPITIISPQNNNR
jgi:hypothetical protein